MINLAFVGLGWWGNELAAAASALSARIKIVGCYSLSQTEMKAFETQYGAIPYPSYGDLLKEPSTDGVVLSTPHSQHANQVIQAANAGKQVFVEKPLALSVHDAYRATKTCLDQEVILAVGHNRRFSSGVSEIKRCLQSGKLGQVLHVEAHFSGNSAMNFSHTTWRANREESPAGALASIGLHMIDTIQYLLGPIERLCCLSKRQVLSVEIDDTTSALFELQSGITGTIGTLFATPSNSLLRIYGTGGLIEAKNEFSEVSFQGDGELYENILIQPSNTLTAEFSGFCDACEGHEAYPVSADEAIRNVAIIEAMSSSSKQMGEWMNISGLLKKGAV
tara:strand:- start:126 stop:1130 length:1005 start_codon:yes stop_codon:yes gene_type:complete